jgi:hypothetical protein
MKMSRKLTTEILQEEAQMYNFILLDEYVPKEKLRIMCKRGHVQQHYPYYFKKAKCEECSKIEKAQSIRYEIESMGYILHNEYENIDTILQTTCPNGHERNCQIYSLRQHQCEQCQNERKLKEIMIRIEGKGYNIVSYPEDARGVMKAICENGHPREAKVYNFINHNCIECELGRPIKYDYEFCRNAFYNKGYILLELDYIDCKTPMSYLCICGEENQTTLDAVLNSNIVGCNKCKGFFNSEENHYNWKGGITSENTKIRHSDTYKYWRSEVLKRDNYTCQCCGKLGGFLNAHHIVNFAEDEEMRFEIDNGITMCEKCHSISVKGSFHNIYGTKNNNQEQLDEYMKNYKVYQSKFQ